MRMLIVDGFSNHDWRKTSEFLRDLFDASGLFSVEVSTSPSSLDDPHWAAWQPSFHSYDLVVLNQNNIEQPELRWPRSTEASFEKYMRRGGGLLAFHSANNSFAHWEEYSRMIGLGWRGKEYGWAIRLDQAGVIERIPPGAGQGTNHGPRQDTLVVHSSTHPIHRGLPARWLTPDLEVYRYARGPALNLNVLSYGLDKQSQEHWPIEWTVRYGRGRVYSSSFGHIWANDQGIPARVRCAGFQTILLRAVEWLVTGKVRQAIPSDFPSDSATSIRELR